jgi:uncharacterized membrane protein YphA (DoxX/SURF4 family)
VAIVAAIALTVGLLRWPLAFCLLGIGTLAWCAAWWRLEP